VLDGCLAPGHPAQPCGFGASEPLFFAARQIFRLKFGRFVWLSRGRNAEIRSCSKWRRRLAFAGFGKLKNGFVPLGVTLAKR
jgi:hypothetical protein